MSKSDIERIRIDNFNGGYIRDTSELLDPDMSSLAKGKVNNSLYDCKNVDINVITNTVSKRPGIALDSSESVITGSRFGILPIVSCYTLKKVYEFIGGDNNLVQILCFSEYLYAWKVYYRVVGLYNDVYVTLDKRILDDNTLVTETDTTIPSNGSFNLNEDEEPVFDTYDGVCRIGLGKSKDPLVLFYNRKEGILTSQQYTTKNKIEKRGLLMTLSKGWYIKRQVFDVIKTLDNSQLLSVDYETQSPDGIGPYFIMSFRWIYVKGKEALVGDINTPYGGTYPFAVSTSSVDRFPFVSVVFDHSTDVSSYSDGTITVGVSDWVDKCDTGYSATQIASLLQKRVIDCLNEKVSIGSISGNKSGQSTVGGLYTFEALEIGTQVTITTNEAMHGAFMIKFQVNVVDGADDNEKKINAKYYLPLIDHHGFVDITISDSYESAKNGIMNLSSNLYLGTYSFKLTSMFANEETIPIIMSTRVNDGTSVYTTSNEIVCIINKTYQKIGLRITLNRTSTNIDPRLSAINIYVKRTIPITETMTSDQRNEAAKYTDIDYRLVRRISISEVQKQELRDLDRCNDIDTIGFQPMIWNTGLYIDFIYSDLISDSTLPQSISQEDTLGTLSGRLCRDIFDEGIVNYLDVCYYRGRRYIYGCKKLIDIDKTEYDEFGNRIYYSLMTPNMAQPDIFSNDSWVSVREGELITKIFEWSDMLLIFTNIDLYVVDTGVGAKANSSDDFTVHDKCIGMGCPYKKTLISTDTFTIWCNENSSYIWINGQYPVDILKGKWKREYQTLVNENMIAGYCPYNMTYWLSFGGSTIYIYSIENLCWTKYILTNITPLYYYKGLDNIFYIPYHITDSNKITKFPYISNNTLQYVDNLIDKYDDVYNNNYESYIITQKLSVDMYDKQFQNVILLYEIPNNISNKLYLDYLSDYEDSATQPMEVLSDILLRLPTIGKPIVNTNIVIPFGCDYGMYLKIKDKLINNKVWYLRCIDAYYTVIDEVIA